MPRAAAKKKKKEPSGLTGLEDLWSRRCDPDLAMYGLDPARPRVVLAHNPQTVERLNEMIAKCMKQLMLAKGLKSISPIRSLSASSKAA